MITVGPPAPPLALSGAHAPDEYPNCARLIIDHPEPRWEDGIRHAILEEPNVGFHEAKFMLVACSAFVNFLISKAEAASLLR